MQVPRKHLKDAIGHVDILVKDHERDVKGENYNTTVQKLQVGWLKQGLFKLQQDLERPRRS